MGTHGGLDGSVVRSAMSQVGPQTLNMKPQVVDSKLHALKP